MYICIYAYRYIYISIRYICICIYSYICISIYLHMCLYISVYMSEMEEGAQSMSQVGYKYAIELVCACVCAW